ncbi:MAG: hypothetical protein LRS46_02605 [Desulfurococcales archaeon]|nr:hypothetical protein [Desulfurococcales archaeon]
MRRRPPLNSILLEERMVAYLDIGAEWFLEKLNEPTALETTSSCMGRISLIEGPWPWERRSDTRIVFKSHSWVNPQRLALECVKPYENLWLKVTGPIIHFRTPSPSCARWLLSIAREEGFKHSGVISIPEEDIGEKSYVIEVTAPTGFSTPLRLNWRCMIPPSSLRELSRASIMALALGRKRLAKLALRVSSEWRESPCL